MPLLFAVSLVLFPRKQIVLIPLFSIFIQGISMSRLPNDHTNLIPNLTTTTYNKYCLHLMVFRSMVHTQLIVHDSVATYKTLSS